MANAQAERRFILDTVGFSTTHSYKVKHIRVYSTPTSVAGVTIINDAAGILRWRWNGVTEQLIENWWYDGFTLATIDGGIVEIEVC